MDGLKGENPQGMAVGQNKWYHFGVGAPPILVFFSGDWDVHWECGILTHGQMATLSFGKQTLLGSILQPPPEGYCKKRVYVPMQLGVPGIIETSYRKILHEV